MPRTARKKSAEALYHIMSRSISETDLFRCDGDKSYYLHLLKRYLGKYHCRLYAYCLMDNHVHLFLNPCGYDVSSFMLSLNTAYVTYYNRRYHRHGHLFQGRFASTIVDNDTYGLTLSAYIHNNVKDLPGYEGREETYRYSSYGIYTGSRRDEEGLVDTEYVLELFSPDKSAAREKYRRFTGAMRGTGILKEVDDRIMREYTQNEYRSEKRNIVRQKTAEELIGKISELLGERVTERLRAKHSRETSGTRAFTTYVMRVLCGYTYKKLCRHIGNMSMSGITRLTGEGYRLLEKESRYREAFNKLIRAG